MRYVINNKPLPHRSDAAVKTKTQVKQSTKHKVFWGGDIIKQTAEESPERTHVETQV